MIRGIGKFLTGIVVGILIVVLSVGIGVYVLLTSDGMMGKIEDSSAGESLSLNFTEEQRAMSLMQFGGTIFGVLGNLANATIGEIETAIGSTLISERLGETIGLDADIIRASTLTGIGETVANNLTVNSLQETFGIGFPEDIPLFRDETFLNSPVSTAFANLDDYEMCKFIDITYPEDATLSKPASSPFLQQMGKKKLSELSGDMDGIIRDTKIGDVLDVDKMENPSAIIKFLKNYTIGNLDKAIETDEHGVPIDGTGGAVQNMTVADVIENTDTSAVLKYLAPFKITELGNPREKDELGNEIVGTGGALVEITIGDAIGAEQAESNKVLNFLKGTTLDKLGERINSMTIGDAVDTSGAHAIINKIADLTLSDLGNSDILQSRINDMKLSEVITINDDSEPILLYFRDNGKEEYPDEPEKWGVKLSELNTAISKMTVKDVFKDADVGILSLIPQNTNVNKITDVLPDKVTTTSLYALMQIGLLTYGITETGNDATDYFQKCSIHNADITAAVNGLGGGSTVKVDIIPVETTALTTAGATYRDGYYVITPEVVRTLLLGKQPGSIIRVVTSGINVKISMSSVEDDSFPVFSLQNAGGTIWFEEGLKMISDRGGYAHFCSPTITINGTCVFTTKMVAKNKVDAATANVLIETADYTPVIP